MEAASHSRRLLLACNLAAVGLLLGVCSARAGTASTWQTIDGSGGFRLQLPPSWSPAAPEHAAATLQESFASPDGQERINIYLASQTISSADLPLFLSTYAGNAALGAPSIGQPQAATVPGAAAAASITASYTDGGGTRVSDTILAAATGSQLYVLDIVAPASDALANAGQIQAIVGSFVIAAS